MDQKGNIKDQKGLKMYEKRQKTEFWTKKNCFFREAVKNYLVSECFCIK